MSDFIGWHAASGAGGKRNWWVSHQEKRLAHRNSKGNLICFGSFQAAQKVADQLNAVPKSYYVKILTPIIVDDVGKKDVRAKALAEFKELIERAQHMKFAMELLLEIQEV